MKFVFTTSIAALLFIVASISTFAHHSVSAEYDSTRATSITGMVTKIEWTNPHVFIYLNVGNGNQSVPWIVQIASRGALEKSGIDKTTIDLAKPVTIEIWPAFSNEGKKHGNGRSLTLSDGRKFDISDKWPDGKGPNNTR